VSLTGFTMPIAETESALLERIDDLSTRILIDGPSQENGGACPRHVQSGLAELAELTRRSGYTDLAAIADDLSTGDAALDEVQAGLERLREAIQNSGGRLSSEPPAADPETAAPSLAQDPEIVGEFLTESRELLISVEQQVLTLEKEPGNADAINSVFRGFHTIKGLAGFLEYASIQEVAHEVETALNLVRSGKLAVIPPVIDVILEGMDYLSRAIGTVESTGRCERCAGHDKLLERVWALYAKESPKPTEPAASQPAPPETIAGGEGDAKRSSFVSELSSVRVDTAKLDYLVDMVGEMVIAQSLVRQNGTIATASDPRLNRDLAQLARITGEVQRTAMAMRMVPINQLFQRGGRQVRDLSRKIGKQVEFVTRGDDTELDKSIAEELADPLMHMMRNAIDHGIEAPEERAAAGKPPHARISLAAYHRAGQVVIEISDDGRGLNSQKILAKARENGLIAPDADLSETDTFRLILEPGLSTASRITGISGRGVGMDVVRRQVEKLRGRIEIRSTPGQGTTFLLRLPLTLAIIDGLVVTVGRERYIVPLFAVKEMFRPLLESVFTVQNRQEMTLVRGRLLPLVRLYKRLGVIPRTDDPSQALLIVAETDGQRFCLMVDDLVGKQEVVIKSLGEGLGNISGVAGGAILGDGRVGLILDMDGLWGTHASV
jgi:two-component system chemotaxis sensor kinase CheA